MRTRMLLACASVVVVVSLLPTAALAQTPTPTTAAAPTVISVAPATVSSTTTTPVTVTGANFGPSATVSIDGTVLRTTFGSPTTLTVVIPAGMPAGSYSVTVTNPGQPPSGPLPNALTVSSLAAVLFVPMVVKRSTDNATTVHVQNVADVATTAHIQYYDPNGVSDDRWMQSVPIAGGAAAVWDQGSHAALPAGFEGSAVIQSERPITAIVNRVNLSGSFAGSPDDVQAAQVRGSAGSYPVPMNGAATQATIPVVFGGYNGYRTTISVQNTGRAPANYTITLYATGSTAPTTVIPRLIPPLAGARIRVGPESGPVPADFVGTAIITSAGGTLVAASETVHSQTGVMLTYAGFAGGANVTNAPLLFKNYQGWVSGAQVVNTSPSSVTVNATLYQRDAAISFGLGTRTLQPNESYTYYLPATPELPDGFVGAGVFNASGPIAVVVQELNADRGTGMAYSGFSGGTQNISIPAIFKEGNGFNSGVQVQNLGSTDAVVNIAYYLPNGQTVLDATLITPGNSDTFYQPDRMEIPAGTVGSARVTSNGPPIVAIVNEVNYTRSGDVSMAYEGINY